MSNKRYWQKTKGTKNFMKIVWKRLEVMIRFATEEDAEELLRIYSYYVENTAITFEYDVPSKDEFEERIKNISAKYPYIKAVHEGKIVGYAYAASFKDRRAYDWSVETTIYVKNNCKRMGIGKVLYEVLEQELKDMGILNMNACIARPIQEGRYLNDDSIRFHDNMGFTEVGHFHNSGYKFGQWFDMIWMEKMIGEHNANPHEVVWQQDFKL